MKSQTASSEGAMTRESNNVVGEAVQVMRKHWSILLARLMSTVGAMLLFFVLQRNISYSAVGVVVTLGAYVLLVCVYLRHERLTQYVVGGAPLLLLYIVNVTSLLANATAGAGCSYFLLAISAPLIFGIRAGIATVSLCILTDAAIIAVKASPAGASSIEFAGPISSIVSDGSIMAIAGFFALALANAINTNGRRQAIRELEDRSQLSELNGRLVELNERYGTLNEQLERRTQRRTLELELANRNLLDANASLEAFNYMVSHDLRSPLQTIDGFSRLLAGELGENISPHAKHYLRRIQSGVERLQSMIAALLRLAQSDYTELQRQRINLSVIAADVVDELRFTDPVRDVRITVQPDLHGYADPILVRELLQNLIGNAWKFTALHPEPTIEIGRSEDGQSFFVRDNGIGFDASNAKELFQPFRRLHPNTMFSGTGVGLAAARRIVERHGGRIRAESVLGKGAQFLFTLNESDTTAAKPRADCTN